MLRRLFVPSFRGSSDWGCNGLECGLLIAFVSAYPDDRFVFKGGRKGEGGVERLSVYRLLFVFVKVASLELISKVLLQSIQERLIQEG